MKYTEIHPNNPFRSQCKLSLHVEQLSSYLNTGDTYPIFMEVSPTNLCNLGCKWCFCNNSHSIKDASLDFNRLVAFFRDFKECGGKAITFSGGGEPTLYRHFIDSVIECKKLDMQVGLITNGTYPNNYSEVIKTNCEWVRFSVDTLNSDKYKAWKGIDMVDRVLGNIMSAMGGKAKIGVNCNVFEEHSIDDIDQFCDLLIDHVDYVQFRPVLPRYYKNEVIVGNEALWQHLTNKYGSNKKVVLSLDKHKDMLEQDLFPFSSCEGHFFAPILDNKGNICVCMYHYGDDNFVFGNINNSTFREIWAGDKRKKVIEFVRKLSYSKECQGCCKLSEVNKFIDTLNNRESIEHFNFF